MQDSQIVQGLERYMAGWEIVDCYGDQANPDSGGNAEIILLQT